MSIWLSLQLLDLLIGLEGPYLSMERINIVNKIAIPLGSLWPFPSLLHLVFWQVWSTIHFWTSLLVWSQCHFLVDVWRLLIWTVLENLEFLFCFPRPSWVWPWQSRWYHVFSSYSSDDLYFPPDKCNDCRKLGNLGFPFLFSVLFSFSLWLTNVSFIDSIIVWLQLSFNLVWVCLMFN